MSEEETASGPAAWVPKGGACRRWPRSGTPSLLSILDSLPQAVGPVCPQFCVSFVLPLGNCLLSLPSRVSGTFLLAPSGAEPEGADSLVGRGGSSF